MIDFSRFRALTFDCYGTLVDWEAGIVGALRPLLHRHGVHASDGEILELYGRLEPQAEAGVWVPYRTVLRRVVEGFGRELGFRPARSELGVLADSLADWPLFPDTVEALERLGRRWKLGVVSNVDDELFAATRERLGVEPAVVVTAEQVRTYKPDPTHFHAALERLQLRRDQLLHVAQSLHHDIGPARELGIATVWVDRRGGKEGSGATPPADAEPDLRVPDLATLVERAALED